MRARVDALHKRLAADDDARAWCPGVTCQGCRRRTEISRWAQPDQLCALAACGWNRTFSSKTAYRTIIWCGICRGFRQLCVFRQRARFVCFNLERYV